MSIAFNTEWNVISENEFKQGLRHVFDNVADALSNTLGPYGTTTIIEKMGDYHISKDGFQVLKSIRYKDNTLNNFLSLLVRISAQVVFQVGDGSTSAIVAANEIIKEFDKMTELKKKYRPKDLLEMVGKCIDTLVDRLYSKAIYINDDGVYDEIRKIAYVSTNGNDEISDIIVDIYKKTNNPAIDYVKSKTNDTTYDIIDGYTFTNMTYLDTIFATDEDGICSINGNCYVLMFDHKVDMETSLPIIQSAMQIAVSDNKRLVVIAPNYDKLLLDFIRRQITAEYKARGTTVAVYCRASLISNMTHTLYNDFAVLAGASIIPEQTSEEDKLDTTNLNNIKELLGEVTHVEIGPTSTLIQGFIKKNDEMYEKICQDAKIKYNELATKYENLGLADTGLNEAKNRMTKLTCSMGIIRVGGKSPLEKAATFDLVDDAVRACESAYRYGYNVGGNLAIIFAVQDELNNRTDDDDPFTVIYKCIQKAFVNVFGCVLYNKYHDDNKSIEIINNLIDDYKNGVIDVTGYDLINDVRSSEVINSCRTDIEILRGALSVVSLVETSNQYISIHTRENN